MRLACFVVTAQALSLAQSLQRSLDEPLDLYVLEKYLPTSADSGLRGFAKLSVAVKDCFSAYDGLIFIMSTGIVVRTIAPFIQDKLTDPAVVVFDEQGQHGISLLSGHVGSANELTRELCQAIGASPVITTATDSVGIIAPDTLATRLALRPWPKVRIKTVNSAVLGGAKIHWRIDKTLPHSVYYKRKLEQEGQWVDLCITSQLLAVLPEEREQIEVVIMAESNLPQLGDLPENILCLTPRRLIAGVGCRRGTPAALVMLALDTACRMIGRDRSFIDVLASTVVKKHEAGILFAGDNLVRPVYFYDNDAMKASIAKYNLSESDFVKQTIGIGNVAEAAAYTCAGERGGRLALRKTKFEKVTVALLWEK